MNLIAVDCEALLKSDLRVGMHRCLCVWLLYCVLFQVVMELESPVVLVRYQIKQGRCVSLHFIPIISSLTMSIGVL